LRKNIATLELFEDLEMVGEGNKVGISTTQIAYSEESPGKN
jgi:hypothetical protein